MYQPVSKAFNTIYLLVESRVGLSSAVLFMLFPFSYYSVNGWSTLSCNSICMSKTLKPHKLIN